jgi:superfamily II DNA or RNA helicase
MPTAGASRARINGINTDLLEDKSDLLIILCCLRQHTLAAPPLALCERIDERLRAGGLAQTMGVKPMQATITIVVDNALRIPLAALSQPAIDALLAAFTHPNPQYHKARRYSKWTKECPEIATWKRDTKAGTLVIPRGGAGRVRAILKEHGIGYAFEDRRNAGEPVAWPWTHEPGGHCNPGCKAWDHQVRIADATVARQNCIARAPTGSGKTTAAIRAASMIKATTMVMVSDGGLARQWKRRLVRELGMAPEDIGFIGDGKFKIRPITVAMQQTLMRMSAEKWQRVNLYFGALIVDEVQRAAANTFVKVIGRSTAKYRIGISADETRKDKKEFLIYDLFGDVACEVTLDELIEKGLIHDVHVRIVPSNFKADWYTAQRNKAAESENAETPDFNRLLAEMVADQDRNALAAQIGVEEVHDGHRVVVFSQRREHASTFNALAAANGIRTGTLLGGEEDSAEFERTVAALSGGDLMWAAGTLQACGTGLDIPAVDVGVVATPIASNRQWFNQVRGRLCRIAPGKRGAWIYYIWDPAVHGLTPLRNLARWANHVEVLDGDSYVEVRDYMRRNKRRLQDAEETERGRTDTVLADIGIFRTAR